MSLMNDKLKQVRTSLRFFESELFHRVQMEQLFCDSKTFADAIPIVNYQTVLASYDAHKAETEFDLKAFVYAHFELPKLHDLYEVSENTDVFKQIAYLWPKLTRPPDLDKIGSLIPLSHSYIVPGGRFREIYYWDSYFTALGLAVSGRVDLVKSMMLNFIEVQDLIGLIPNGNRSYYYSRSQPPVLALLLEIVIKYDDEVEVNSNNPFFVQCLEALENEYNLWMSGETSLKQHQSAHRRVVKLEDCVMNRFWDDSDKPRAESYSEDVRLAEGLAEDRRPYLFRSLRAACESGWDFSSRWLKDPHDLITIHTTDILPIDLNSLLFKLENDLAAYYNMLQQNEKATVFTAKSSKRYEAIQSLMWNEQEKWFYDFDFVENKQKALTSLAGVVPLFVGLATKEQSIHIRNKLMQKLLKPGGLITTLETGKQQWDSPNGWAPLQYFACKGLLDYGYDEDAYTIMQAWVNLVKTSFEQTHSIMEKYDVINIDSAAKGGEYEVQEGFGWTNGVTLIFDKLLKDRNTL